MVPVKLRAKTRGEGTSHQDLEKGQLCDASATHQTQNTLPTRHEDFARYGPASHLLQHTACTAQPQPAAQRPSPPTHSLLATLRSVISTPAKGSVALLSGMTPEKLFPARWTMCRLG